MRTLLWCPNIWSGSDEATVSTSNVLEVELGGEGSTDRSRFVSFKNTV